MPLHLLGKKSWNVYNPESIARVRKDEAAAKLRDAEEERRGRDNDSTLRLQLLRAGNIEDAVIDPSARTRSISPDRSSRQKRRRLHGENDTDRELRLAQGSVLPTPDSSLVDSRGHIDLTAGASTRKLSKPDFPLEAGMRLIDAAGTKQGSAKPWYSDQIHKTSGGTGHEVSRDRWGNEDPRRLQREQQRLNANDPLVAMKKGVRRLKENEKQREAWIAQRERDFNEVRELAQKHRRRKGHPNEEDSLEGFDLDAQMVESPERRHRSRSHHHHSHSRHGQERRRRTRSKSPLPSFPDRYGRRRHDRIGQD